MGNSEVGHLNIGAGRVIYQDITRIDKSIDDGDFFTNPVLKGAMDRAAAGGHAVHLFGLISNGGVHSSMKHLDALIDLAKRAKVQKLFLHAFMDGRDTSPTSGAGFIKERLAKFAQAGVGEIATLMGRYWGMDRDKRWERIEKAYCAIVNRQGTQADDPLAAVEASYAKDVTDEFIEPVVFRTRQPFSYSNGDICLFFNFRADRVRELSSVLCKQTESTFPHPEGADVEVISLTLYDEKLPLKIAYPYHKHDNILTQLLAGAGKRVLKIAETEKYPHVTYFFNGGEELRFPGEVWEMIRSPKVATYDLQPEMSAPEVAAKCAALIRAQQFEVVVLNFANPDMVGHTGIIHAAVQAIQAVDRCVGEVMSAVEDVGGSVIITSDHGNAEMMIDKQTGKPFTAHTTNPVPLLFYDKSYRPALRSGGILADIAPTMLTLLKMNIPADMTGKSLFL